VVGAKDLADGMVTVVRRLDGEQSRVPVDTLAVQLPRLLDDAHHALRARALRMLDDYSREVSTIAELQAAFADGPVWANAPFCNTKRCEDAVKASVHAVTVRNLRADRSAGGTPCLACGEPAEHVALIARAY
jgi:prolyl-tRNA synthetase